jgi:hypothetical protein
MAENEGEETSSNDLRAMTPEQRAEWLARTLVNLSDGADLWLEGKSLATELHEAAEVVLSSGWQPGAYAELAGDTDLVGDEDDGEGGTDAG